MYLKINIPDIRLIPLDHYTYLLYTPLISSIAFTKFEPDQMEGAGLALLAQ